MNRNALLSSTFLAGLNRAALVQRMQENARKPVGIREIRNGNENGIRRLRRISRT